MDHFSNDWLRNGGTGLATSYNHFKPKCRVSFKKRQFREILHQITHKTCDCSTSNFQKMEKNEKKNFFF